MIDADIEVTARTDGRPLTMTNPRTRLFVSPTLLIVDDVRIDDPAILAQAVEYEERPEADGWKWCRLAVNLRKAKAMHRQAMIDALFPVVPALRRAARYLRVPLPRRDADAAPYRLMVAKVLGAGPLPARWGAPDGWWFGRSTDPPSWMPPAPHTLHSDAVRQEVEIALRSLDSPSPVERGVIFNGDTPVRWWQR